MIVPAATRIGFTYESGDPPPGDLVSVAVSLHNYARFLPECLDSVANQRHRALEIIVVDDASDADDSVSAATDWLQANAGRFHRALLLCHTRNQGLAQARNTAFAAARGGYVFVLDADNTLYPRAIARLYEAASREGLAAAYCQLERFGAVSGLGLADLWDSERFSAGNYVDAMALVSREAWREAGGYTHLDGGWEDFDFWCKFIDRGMSAAYIPEILCRYRVHGGSMLHTQHKPHVEQLKIQMALRHPWLRFA